MRQRRISIAAVIVTGLLLVGCSSQTAPAATPEPAEASSTPVAEVEPVAGIVVGGRTLTTVDADGTTLGSVDFASDGAAAVEFLTDSIGSAPVLSARASDESCTPAADIATWNDTFAVVYNTEGLPANQQFEVHATGAAVADIEIVTPTGFSVGDPVADLIATVPDAHVDLMEYEGTALTWVDYDVAEGAWTPGMQEGTDDSPYWGAKAVAEDGILTRLDSPAWLVDLC